MQGKDNLIVDMQLTEMKIICSREHGKLVLHSLIWEIKGNFAFSYFTRTPQNERKFWSENALECG